MMPTWNKVGLVTGLAAGIAVVLHLSGCVEELPTEGTGAGNSSNVVRGAGCVPEVLTSSTESTDTILVTFTATLAPDQYSCTPNLVQWGIDMADPVGVDTPQGNGYFRIETHPDLHISNTPSPSMAALGGGYSPAQVVIEFDPPVRSVEFWYSRRPQSRAWWVIDGVWQEVQTESTWVQATSRVPGTLNYTLYDEEHLYTNSSPGNWDGWTHTKLSAPADKIQWLSIFGILVIDDLKIVRKPLSCTPATVRRGQQVRCEIVLPAGWSVTRWEFVPEGSAGAAVAALRAAGTEELELTATASSSLPTVVENTTNTVWAGGVSVGGLVRVSVTNGGAQRTYETQFSVSNRPTDWRSQWSYRQGPEQTVADAEVSSSNAAFGRNCPARFATEAACLAAERSRVQPDPMLEPDAGYTATKWSAGPNNTFWYVSSIRYDMKRVANVHPGMLLTSPRKHPVPASALTRDCKRGLGLTNKASSGDANMNQFNQFCAPPTLLGTDMTIFVPAIWGHEGFGYNSGVGHETLGQQAAGESQNDPYRVIETLTAPDSLTLAKAVDQRIFPIGDDITMKAKDSNAINGGPKNNYDPTQFPTREMWFWEIGSGGFPTWVRRPLTSKY